MKKPCSANWRSSSAAVWGVGAGSTAVVAAEPAARSPRSTAASRAGAGAIAEEK